MSAIEIKNVSKKFRVYHDKSITLKERLLFFNRTKYEEHQVLDNISFNVEQGTTVGLIGQNGSGKSTLLKLLTGIIYPDSGEIKINGRVSSLLELGAGFHPDFSGRENIYNNASIFGLTRSEIDKRYNQIVEFSELQEYIDNPVRTYSSGMYMRLAFSVAINVNADILLIDEILAVGDANFQKKCMDKIKELKHAGKTIVIVTHDTGSVERICDKAAWINNGNVELFDQPRVVIDTYLQYMGEKEGEKLYIESGNSVEEEPPLIQADIKTPKVENKRWGNKQIEITDVKMLNTKFQEKHMFLYTDSVTIEIEYNVNKQTEDFVFGIGIFTKDRVQCYGTNTHIDRLKIGRLKEKGIVKFTIPNIELIEGSYCLDVAVHSEEGFPYDYQMERYFFNVQTGMQDIGIYKPKHEWMFE
jgi:ABC-type polysaccharide/polyol phosphate transport system ATPase subunit